jgi:copper chaperone CopZ
MAEFTVPDMDCEGCVRSITSAVKRVAPNAEVMADLATKLVRVTGDGTAEAFAAAMRDAGFTPESRAA